MTNKVFQKSAVTSNIAIPHKGVLRPHDFADGFTFWQQPPTKDLAPYVDYIWVIRWDLPKNIMRTSPAILPNPQINLFFDDIGAGVQGVFKTNKTYRGTGTGGVAGATFKPSGFYAFWPHSAASLTDTSVPLHDIMPNAPHLSAATLLTNSNEAIAVRINEYLQALQPQPDKNITLVQDIITAIAQTEPTPTVGQLAEQFKKSERAIQQMFKTYVGVGIKWILMRNRLLAATEQASMQSTPNWATIALDLGYASQAHFITDFTRTIGMQPSKYVRYMRGTNNIFLQR